MVNSQVGMLLELSQTYLGLGEVDCLIEQELKGLAIVARVILHELEYFVVVNGALLLEGGGVVVVIAPAYR